MRTTRPTIPYLLLAVIVVLVFAIADGAELRRENTELRRFITGELAQVRERAIEAEERIIRLQKYLEAGESPGREKNDTF
jgi:sensor domain CHASE-containing protein